jgi:hypothetical protein
VSVGFGITENSERGRGRRRIRRFVVPKKC